MGKEKKKKKKIKTGKTPTLQISASWALLKRQRADSIHKANWKEGLVIILVGHVESGHWQARYGSERELNSSSGTFGHGAP